MEKTIGNMIIKPHEIKAFKNKLPSGQLPPEVNLQNDCEDSRIKIFRLGRFI